MNGQHDFWRQSADGEDGFTLVEALAAAVLMAILLGLLATLTGHWMANWKPA
ncbi:MAG: prepilin-type N-terminal cleavage/methylation domain-containing protein, partial [Alphaproteobacteria bacterium]|nr:prepilin-type N-terminal cleavage/methylation domain-containing protein [Alphaproteobacteria bacterium]